MASRASLNKVLLIGNLTRDPELRYTPQGTAVCTFGLATNRSYTASDGQKKEEAEFHRVVSWNKLAELCSQLLVKGRKVYVEGRIQNRTWQTPAGEQRNMTEIVIEDMRILDSKRPEGGIEVPDEIGSQEVKEVGESGASQEAEASTKSEDHEEAKPKVKGKEKKEAAKGTPRPPRLSEAGGDAGEPREELREKGKPKQEEAKEEEILDDLPF